MTRPSLAGSNLPGDSYTIEYQRYEIRPEARATLKPGKNVLAVHCRRVDKGRYIDVGVVDPK